MKITRRLQLFTAGMVIVLALMFFGGGTALAEGGFAGGTGTSVDPWLIETPEQLASVAEAVYCDSHFKLNTDINLATYLSEGNDGWNDGKGWEPIGTFLFSGSPGNVPFTGSFDGNGHTISNLIINRADKGGIGLFSHTVEDTGIFNLRLTAVEVTGSFYVGGLVGENKGEISNCSIEGSITGNDEVGGLVGWQWDTGTISDSYATGDVTGCIKDTSPPEDIGGLVGNNGGSITNSYAMVTVNVDGYVNEDDNYEYSYVGGLAGINGGGITNSYATGDVTGLYSTDDESAGYCIGGLVGFNSAFGSGATITNSYATGQVTGEEYVGGLAGNNGGHITNSYATGQVTGEENIGGLVGYTSGGTVTASYYDEETTTQNDDGKGTKKTTGEMQLRSTYADWNFLSIWGIEDDEGYPVLRWQDGAPQSGFEVTAADPVYMGIEFQLDISQAQGADGDTLNGDVSVRVYSETQAEDVAESEISFSDGEAAVPVTLDASGTHDLRVFADGVSYSNLLTVELLAVVNIAVTNPPNKINYFIGEEIDLTGLEVTGTYSDDFTGVLPITTANISGFDSSETADDQVVTVTYAGLTDTFTVDIIEPQLESIAVTSLPAKTTYYVGDSLELNGLEVIGTLEDDSTEELTITLDNISGFDSSAAAADQVVTVTYADLTDTFTVDIITAPVYYTVTYNANGGTGAVPTESDKTQGATFTAASADSLIPPEDKQFKEWNTDADGEGTGYAVGAEVTMPEENLTLYAVWEDIPAVTYTVTFNKNGGDTEASPATKTVVSGGTVDALPTAPTRSGYTFKGWNTMASGNGSTFTASTPVTGDLTVYSQWTASGGSSSGSGGSSSRPASSNSINASTGGQVSLNGVEVIIPAGTLVQDAFFSITRITSGEVNNYIPQAMQFKLGSEVYEITTGGEREFGDKFLSIRIPYDPVKIAEGEKPVIHFRDEGTGEWSDLPTTLEQDPVSGQWYAVIQVNHLTKFAVFSTKVREIILTIGQTSATVAGQSYIMDAVPVLDAATGRTLAPLRFISEALGAKVEWLAASNQVRITEDNKEIILTPYLKEALINGEKKYLDCPPVIAPPGRIFVPLRFIGESLDAEVAYDAYTREIRIVR